MTSMTRLRMLAGGLLMAACMPSWAEGYPNRPVKLVVGFSAGGPTDVPARMVAASLSKTLGQTVVVENRTGAGGKIAADYVAAQAPDGYTLLLCTHIDAINTVLYKSRVVQLADLTPISTISKYYYLAAVNNALPVKDMKEFIAYAKQRPGELNYGQVGTGSSFELLTKRIEKDAGIRMTSIPYRGSTEMVQDFLAGRVQFMTAAPISVLPLHEAGKIRLIGTTSPQRLTNAPDVPTMTEEGFPITWFGWLGLCGPKGLGADVVQRLNEGVVKAVNEKDFRTLMDNASSIPMASTPNELRDIFQATATDSQAMIKEYQLQLE